MKTSKKLLSLMLAAILILMSFIIPVSAATRIDPSEGPAQRIEIKLYQLLDKLISNLLKILNVFIPGLNFGNNWQNYKDYKSPNEFYSGETEFDTTLYDNSTWSAGYACTSLLEGFDIFSGNMFVAGTLEPFSGRLPSTLVDDQRVDAFALSDGTSGIIVQAVVDGYGLARGDVLKIRSILDNFAKTNNIISINISTLHQHSCIDTLGMAAPLLPALIKNPAYSLFGSDLSKFVNGKNTEFMESLYSKVASTIMSAVENMTEGTLYYGNTDVSDMIHDKRDPITYDGNLHRFRFVPFDESLSEIWLCEASIHCVGFGASSDKVSSDYPYYFKKYLKEFANANVVYTLGAELALAMDYENVSYEETQINSKVKAFGEELGNRTLAIENEIALDPILNIKFNEMTITPDNQVLTLAVREGLINTVITKDKLSYKIITEIGYMELGNEVGIVFIPGEIAAEIIFGGSISKDKSWNNQSFDHPSIKEIANINNLICIGLNNDQIGYILPDNDYRSILTENEEINAASKVLGSTIVKSFNELISSVK